MAKKPYYKVAQGEVGAWLCKISDQGEIGPAMKVWADDYENLEEYEGIINSYLRTGRVVMGRIMTRWPYTPAIFAIGQKIFPESTKAERIELLPKLKRAIDLGLMPPHPSTYGINWPTPGQSLLAPSINLKDFTEGESDG